MPSKTLDDCTTEAEKVEWWNRMEWIDEIMGRMMLDPDTDDEDDLEVAHAKLEQWSNARLQAAAEEAALRSEAVAETFSEGAEDSDPAFWDAIDGLEGDAAIHALLDLVVREREEEDEPVVVYAVAVEEWRQ